MFEKVFVISDTHIGDGTNRDDFKKNKKYFLDFLDFVQKESAYLVFNGDILELLQCPLGEIFEANQDIFEALSELDILYIIGNHDDGVLKNERIKAEIEKKLPKAKIEPEAGMSWPAATYIMHGHQFDPFNHNGLKWIGDTIAWIGGQLELIDPDIDKKFSNWRRKVSSWFAKGSQRLSGTGRYGNESKYIDLAIDYVKKMKDAVLYNKVILGHTHKPAVVKVNNMIYYNCGCWVEDDFRYIEIREGYTELKKFEKSNRFYSS